MASAIWPVTDSAIRWVASRLPGREAALGELLGRALVLVPGADLQLHAQLVQRAAEEGPLDGQAGEAEVARRLEVDRVEGGGQVVRHVARGELAERLGPGPGRLARGAEPDDRLAQLLGRAEADRLAARPWPRAP